MSYVRYLVSEEYVFKISNATLWEFSQTARPCAKLHDDETPTTSIPLPVTPKSAPTGSSEVVSTPPPIPLSRTRTVRQPMFFLLLLHVFTFTPHLSSYSPCPAHRSAQVGPRSRPKTAARSPKTTPRRPRMAPTRFQDGPNVTPRRSQDDASLLPPRGSSYKSEAHHVSFSSNHTHWPIEVPRTTQHRFGSRGHPQDISTTPPRCPKMPHAPTPRFPYLAPGPFENLWLSYIVLGHFRFYDLIFHDTAPAITIWSPYAFLISSFLKADGSCVQTLNAVFGTNGSAQQTNELTFGARGGSNKLRTQSWARAEGPRYYDGNIGRERGNQHTMSQSVARAEEPNKAMNVSLARTGSPTNYERNIWHERGAQDTLNNILGTIGETNKL